MVFYRSMKKIILIVALVIFVVIAGRAFWAYQQFKPLRDAGFFTKKGELERVNLGIDYAKKWQSDATLYGMSILKLPHSYAYATLEFFSVKNSSCYSMQINRRLEVVDTFEIACDSGAELVVLDTKDLSVDSVDVILLLNWYAHYSKLPSVQRESTVNLSLIKDEATGKLVWVGQTLLTEWLTGSESFAPVIMVDATTGKLLKTLVVKKHPDGKVAGDHYD